MLIGGSLQRGRENHSQYAIRPPVSKSSGFRRPAPERFLRQLPPLMPIRSSRSPTTATTDGVLGLDRRHRARHARQRQTELRLHLGQYAFHAVQRDAAVRHETIWLRQGHVDVVLGRLHFHPPHHDQALNRKREPAAADQAVAGSIFTAQSISACITPALSVWASARSRHCCLYSARASGVSRLKR